MQSVWLSLLWKEWREHRMKLAALSGVAFLTLFLICFTFRNNIIDVFAFMTTSLGCYVFMTTFFVAMNVAGGESSRKTMPFLQSLPVPMWQPAAAKLLLASLTLILPLLLVMAFVYLPFLLGAESSESVRNAIDWDQGRWPQPWGIDDWFTARLVGSVLGILSFLLWLTAAGVNRSDEIRAGAVGFLTVTAVWLCFAGLWYIAEKKELPTIETFLKVAISAAPGGPGYSVWTKSNTLACLLIALVGHAGAGAWFLGRFGQVKFKSNRGGARDSVVQVDYTLGPPRHSQSSAIAWKQLRETGPLAAFALAATLAFTAIVLLADETKNVNFKRVFIQIGTGMSFFVVLVAGIGLYLDELKPGLNNFWRSRPNDLRLWFGVKYVAGLLVLIAVLGVPLFMAGLFYWSEGHHDLDWNEFWNGAHVATWVLTITYSIGMTAQCLTRQPLYAAALTVSILMIGAYLLAKFNDNLQLSTATNVTIMIVSLVVVIALAWQTVKHDWGWK